MACLAGSKVNIQQLEESFPVCRGAVDVFYIPSEMGFLIKKKESTCHIADFSIPVEHRVKIKMSKKSYTYLDIARELKKLCNIRVTVIPIVAGALGSVLSRSQIFFSRFSGYAPRVLNMVYINVILMSHNFFNSLTRLGYSSILFRSPDWEKENMEFKPSVLILSYPACSWKIHICDDVTVCK